MRVSNSLTATKADDRARSGRSNSHCNQRSFLRINDECPPLWNETIKGKPSKDAISIASGATAVAMLCT
jgi:hypothetical protein